MLAWFHIHVLKRVKINQIESEINKSLKQIMFCEVLRLKFQLKCKVVILRKSNFQIGPIYQISYFFSSYVRLLFFMFTWLFSVFLNIIASFPFLLSYFIFFSSKNEKVVLFGIFHHKRIKLLNIWLISTQTITFSFSSWHRQWARNRNLPYLHEKNIESKKSALKFFLDA